MVMMEILGVLSAAGVAPSKSTFTQLATAIRAVNRQAVILADTGTANAYAAANTPALTALPATGYLQRVNIATLNTTASTYSLMDSRRNRFTAWGYRRSKAASFRQASLPSCTWCRRA